MRRENILKWKFDWRWVTYKIGVIGEFIFKKVNEYKVTSHPSHRKGISFLEWW